MIHYRPSRNTDPPALADVWNATFTGQGESGSAGRGAVPLRTPFPLERWVFSKPYFQANALQVAEHVADDGRRSVVGFALSGSAPNAERNALDPTTGVICAVVVHPKWRRQGIGRELVRRAESCLRDHGATTILLGSQTPNNPFLFGIYGGCNSPGILDSDTDARPFLTALGYQPTTSVVVLHRQLDQPLAVADPRFSLLRRRYDVQLLKSAALTSWWDECVWSSLEPAEFRMMDKLTNIPAARAVAWELEGFGWRWNAPSAGIIDVQVRPDLRRQGLGKLLLFHILKFLQDQFFGIVELQARADDAAGIGLCSSLGFQQVDVGHVYRRPA